MCTVKQGHVPWPKVHSILENLDCGSRWQALVVDVVIFLIFLGKTQNPLAIILINKTTILKKLFLRLWKRHLEGYQETSKPWQISRNITVKIIYHNVHKGLLSTEYLSDCLSSFFAHHITGFSTGSQFIFFWTLRDTNLVNWDIHK